MKTIFLEVEETQYLGDFKILIKFNNGINKVVDLENELNGDVFEPLKNPAEFKNFKISFNTIEWPNGADFAPEFLYQIGVIKQ